MKVEFIVIHCTATQQNISVNTLLNNWRRLGWKSNGYHWLIDMYGISVRLVDDSNIANGVKGYNDKAIHLAYIGGLVGNKAEDTRTLEQKQALINLVQHYKSVYPMAKVLGHRDLSPDKNNNGIIEPFEWVKICPCFDVKNEFINIAL